MANQIASFYETMPDRQTALADIADHLKKFWDPRMRRELLEYIDTTEATGLKPIVLESLRQHRSVL